MRETVTVQVEPGQTLQLYSAEGPVGDLIQIPEDVASVTIIVLDTERLERARARQAKLRMARRNQLQAARQRRARAAGAEGGAGAAKGAGAPARRGRRAAEE